MGKVLLYDAGHIPFAKVEIVEVLQSIPQIATVDDVSTVMSYTTAVFKSDANGDVVIRLLPPGRVLTVEGSWEVVADAVIQISRQFGRPIQMIDQGYTFDVCLDNCKSSLDLLRQIGVMEP